MSPRLPVLRPFYPTPTTGRVRWLENNAPLCSMNIEHSLIFTYHNVAGPIFSLFSQSHLFHVRNSFDLIAHCANFFEQYQLAITRFARFGREN